jgi:hypothetical protein
MRAIWGENAEAGQVAPGLRHQGDEPGNDVQDALMSRAQDAQERLKSSGSKMTCVVITVRCLEFVTHLAIAQ